jgi:putative ABC transport system permease protein
MRALGLRMGDTLLLGDARLQVARILTQEPDRGAGFMNFAPRVLMNVADLPATGLVQPASRITYRFAVAGTAQDSARFARWAEQYVANAGVRGLRVETLEIPAEFLGKSYDSDEQYRLQFQQWVNQLWQAKDRQLQDLHQRYPVIRR